MPEKPPAKPPNIPPPPDSQAEDFTFVKPAETEEWEAEWTPKMIQKCKQLAERMDWKDFHNDRYYNIGIKRNVIQDAFERSSRDYFNEIGDLSNINVGYMGSFDAIISMLLENRVPLADKPEIPRASPRDVGSILTRMVEYLGR